MKKWGDYHLSLFSIDPDELLDRHAEPLQISALAADGDLGAVLADVIDFADSLRAGAHAAFTDVGHVGRRLFGRFRHEARVSAEVRNRRATEDRLSEKFKCPRSTV